MEEEQLLGCWQEARRADKVAAELIRIKETLGLEFYDNITRVLREVESISRLLRDLYDLVPIYRSRVPTIIYYLDVVLPTLYKTLKDMLVYIANHDLSSRMQWILLRERMGVVAGMDLAERHMMYNDFLVQLIRLLSKYESTSI